MRVNAGSVAAGCNSSERLRRRCKPCKREPPTARLVPNVEQALLRAFRQGPSRDSASRKWRGELLQLLFSLSRFFEVGAYVAVAAAIAIALFLGVRIWEERSGNLPVKSHAVQPSVEFAKGRGCRVFVRGPAATASGVREAALPGRDNRMLSSASQSNSEPAESSQISADAGYVALMFCDPLSCSSDAQVVRMELPAAGTHGFGWRAGCPDAGRRCGRGL